MDKQKGINLSDLFLALVKKWYITAATIIVGVVFTAIMAFFVITPKYGAVLEFRVGRKEGVAGGPTVLEIRNHIDSNFVLNDISNGLKEKDIEISPQVLKANLKYFTRDYDYSLRIKFVSSNKKIIVDVLYQVLESSTKEYIIREDGSVYTSPYYLAIEENSEILSNVQYDSPNKTLYLIVGFLLGAIVGVTITFVIEFGKNTYKTQEEIEDDLDVRMIGSISKIVYKEDQHEKE